MGAMVVAMAAPAFAAANPHASCQGAAHSNQFPGPGGAGDFHSFVGPTGFNGGIAREYAKQGPQGQDRNSLGAIGPQGELCITS
jgi:hypothetical protein